MTRMIVRMMVGMMEREPDTRLGIPAATSTMATPATRAATRRRTPPLKDCAAAPRAPRRAVRGMRPGLRGPPAPSPRRAEQPRRRR